MCPEWVCLCGSFYFLAFVILGDNHMEHRLVRLISILGLLSPHSQVTIRDLAVEYGVSTKTAQRNVNVLRDAKLGVYQDECGKVKITRMGYKKIKSWLLA